MPATDILNPIPNGAWQDDVQDSMNPNYGFTRKRATTKLNKKAVGGTPWSRDTQNTGHTFTFSWLSRSWACVQRLKRYYEQYEDGFFTIIDWDGGGRHFVGRFTTEVSPVETGNGMWDVQNVTFEEVPQQVMMQYPSDWDNDAVKVYPFNDFSDQKLATLSNFTPGWAPNVRSIQGKQCTTMDNPGASASAGPPPAGKNVGDWACYEYRGYGFKLYLLKGPTFGQCTISVDGNVLGGIIEDTFIPTVFDCYASAVEGPQPVCIQPNLPLDFHRVQVNITGTKNAESTGAVISWHSLQVMR